jgi:phage-related tail protein
MNSCWALLKENRKATGKCPNKQIPPGQRFLDSLWEILKGYWKTTKKSTNITCQPIGKKAELAISKIVAISISFLRSAAFLY